MNSKHLVSFEKTVMVVNIDGMLLNGLTVTEIMQRNTLYIESAYLEIVQSRAAALDKELKNAETIRLESVVYEALQALEDHLKTL